MKCQLIGRNRSRAMLSLVALLSFIFVMIGVSAGQNCNDTVGWNNSAQHACPAYQHFSWCFNNTNTFVPDTEWTGGDAFKYPEFNCCICGKGWPLWFVPVTGYRAYEARPNSIVSTSSSSSVLLSCNDTYRDANRCTMKCKSLPAGQSVTSLATIISPFNETNCTLKSNISWTIQIPMYHYLVFFTDWITTNFTLSCSDAASGESSPPPPSMLCRYEVDPSPFQGWQCPSTSVTSRFTIPGCIDTANWVNSHGWSCFEYEMIFHWCANGTYTFGNSWTLGSVYWLPEQNCCACGKGRLSPSVLSSNSLPKIAIDPSQYDLIRLNNCSAASHDWNWSNWTNTVDLLCLGLINFTNNSRDMNSTLYECPVNCFFNWNMTVETSPNATVQVVRYRSGPSIVYILTSPRFSHSTIRCEIPIDDTSSPSTALTTADESTQAPPLWKKLQCDNGKLGAFCNISSDPCLLSQPCLNDGTCISNSSSYECVCPPWRYSGVYCEIDIRPCQPFTCRGHGSCLETGFTSFRCQCYAGYRGANCESLISLCENVTCQNGAPCRASAMNFTCECTSTEYSGRYCESVSSALAAKRKVTRSFGYIVIITIVSFMLFIVTLDVLKYVFGIDPVGDDYRRMQAKKRLQKQLAKRRPVIVRHVYTNRSTLETIPEE